MTARLVVLRTHQRDAGLDQRERLAARAKQAAGPDLLVLDTCHRVECYAAAPAAVDPRPWIAARLGLPPGGTDLEGTMCDTGEDAARHLMRVAAGLDSVVSGEGQVLLQLRRAFDAARAAHPLDAMLTRAVQRALHVARELRATTALGTVRRSVGSLAVDCGVRALAEPDRATAMVIGAGEVGRLAGRALARRVGAVVVANRDPRKGQALAAEIGARSIALEDIDEGLAVADLVISAADTRGGLLTTPRLTRRLECGPLTLVDIAVPRSVAAADRTLGGLVYIDVDHLTAGQTEVTDELMADAERRCATEAARLVADDRGRAAARTIEALHQHAERTRQRQLERAAARLGHLSERDRRVVDALSRSLTTALLHTPTTALKVEPDDAAAARRLFGVRDAR